MSTLERLANTDAPIGPYNGYLYRELLRGALKVGL
jgi:hypothetical protein